MKFRHLVDAEILAVLDAYPAFDFSPSGMAQTRARFIPAELVADPDVTVSEQRIAGLGGAHEVRLVCYAAKGAPAPSPALLHIHGGGYVMGSPEMNDAQSKRLAKVIGGLVVSVDYRLAPETAAPGGVEDCFAALKWLFANAETLGIDPARVAIGGESAGGGLAAALGLMARDRAETPPLAFQYLTYPMLDDRTSSAGDHHVYAEAATWTDENNRFGWAALLGLPIPDKISPYAAPARATSLAGLPPTFITVGALDLFLGETLDYARRLIADGVATELHVYPGAFHGFNAVLTAGVAQRFLRDQHEALKRALQTP
jgi:acetyl esterase/lipase